MRAEALLIGILMLSASLAGCFKEDTSPPPPEEPSLPDGIFLTGPDGLNLSLDLYQLLPLSFVFSNVGEDGAEPSIGWGAVAQGMDPRVLNSGAASGVPGRDGRRRGPVHHPLRQFDSRR